MQQTFSFVENNLIMITIQKFIFFHFLTIQWQINISVKILFIYMIFKKNVSFSKNCININNINADCKNIMHPTHLKRLKKVRFSTNNIIKIAYYLVYYLPILQNELKNMSTKCTSS